MELNYWQSMASKERADAGAVYSDNSDKETNDIRLTKPDMQKKNDRFDSSLSRNSRFEEVPSFDDSYDTDGSTRGYDAPVYSRDSYNDRSYSTSKEDSVRYADHGQDRDIDAQDHYNTVNYDHDSYDHDDYRHDDYDHDGYDHDGYDHDGYDHDGYDQDDYEHDEFEQDDIDPDKYDSDDFGSEEYDSDEYESDEYEDDGYEDIPQVNIPDSVFDMKASATPPDIDYTDDDFLSVSEEPIQHKPFKHTEDENPQSLKFQVSYDQIPEAEPDDDKRLSIKRLKVSAGIKVKDESRPFTFKGLILFIFLGIPICIPLFLIGLGIMVAVTGAAFVVTVISAILTMLLAVIGIGAFVLGGIYVLELTSFALIAFSAGAAALCFAVLFMLLTTVIAVKVFPKLFSLIGLYCSKCIDKVR